MKRSYKKWQTSEKNHKKWQTSEKKLQTSGEKKVTKSNELVKKLLQTCEKKSQKVTN